MIQEYLLHHMINRPHNKHSLNRYIRFINSCSSLESYTEKHHILPKSNDMFPEFSKDKNNIIKLSPRQHFIAHWMLSRVYDNAQSQTVAFFLMCSKHKINSKTYAKLKIKNAKRVAEVNTKTKLLPRETVSYICHRCKSTFNRTQSINAKPKKYAYCKLDTCTKTSKEKQCIYPKPQSSGLGRAWNKGQTAKTNPAIAKYAESCKGRTAWNIGKINPTAANNGKKSAAKQSKTVTGRKLYFYSVTNKKHWSYYDSSKNQWYIRYNDNTIYI